ncbi:hypothetical protein D3C87_701570 [compost metagenome]
MKLFLSFVICFFSVSAFSYSEVQNWPNNSALQGNACSVEAVIISCVNGGEAAAPGCAISCRENQIAKCVQGETFAYSCKGLPARCTCE